MLRRYLALIRSLIFLDKRNEVDLISCSKVFVTVPHGKLLRQDKYLNGKTREGDRAGSHRKAKPQSREKPMIASWDWPLT